MVRRVETMVDSVLGSRHCQNGDESTAVVDFIVVAYGKKRKANNAKEKVA
jgi:hypothetical protein